MPDGYGESTPEEIAKMKSRFEPFRSELEAIAGNLGMLITEYSHGSAGWDFAFLHPKGGLGSLWFSYRMSSDDFELSGHWLRVDKDKRMLRQAVEPRLHYDPRKPIGEQVRSMLRKIISFEAGDSVPIPNWTFPKGYGSYEELIRRQYPGLGPLKNTDRL